MQEASAEFQGNYLRNDLGIILVELAAHEQESLSIGWRSRDG
jgi:hypothetical protein